MVQKRDQEVSFQLCKVQYIVEKTKRYARNHNWHKTGFRLHHLYLQKVNDILTSQTCPPVFKVSINIKSALYSHHFSENINIVLKSTNH